MSEKLKRALLSYARVFAGAALGAYIALDESPFQMGVDDVKVVVSAGVAALAVVLFNALNPKDTRYGVTSKPDVRRM